MSLTTENTFHACLKHKGCPWDMIVMIMQPIVARRVKITAIEMRMQQLQDQLIDHNVVVNCKRNNGGCLYSKSIERELDELNKKRAKFI